PAGAARRRRAHPQGPGRGAAAGPEPALPGVRPHPAEAADRRGVRARGDAGDRGPAPLDAARRLAAAHRQHPGVSPERPPPGQVPGAPGCGAGVTGAVPEIPHYSLVGEPAALAGFSSLAGAWGSPTTAGGTTRYSSGGAIGGDGLWGS